jgi:hypothetical protein
LPRMDFIAVIIEPSGNKRKVLIELQKGSRNTDIGRFRRYLAQNYEARDVLNAKEVNLEIISIYIVGFPLNVPVAVVKTSTKLIDASTEQELDAKTDDDSFIRQLHHESIFVDTTKLSSKLNTKIDRLLALFNQAYVTDKKYQMSFPDDVEEQMGNEYKIFTKRLEHALLDKDILFHINEQEKFNEFLENDRLDIKFAAKLEVSMNIAKNLKNKGLSIEYISEATGLAIEKIQSMT